MSTARAFAKVNLALVVGPIRPDGKHEVATVLQKIDLCDLVAVMPSSEPGIRVDGYPEDTLVTSALRGLAEATGTRPRWDVSIEKRIPVGAGLGGGSADAAAALELANPLVAHPLTPPELQAVARRVGSDVPFLLAGSQMLAVGDGTELVPLVLPQDFAVLLVLPRGEHKESTAAVYRTFDERRGADGFEGRRKALLEALTRVDDSPDLSALPRNDLASSAVSEELERRGAFRADVSGAGPVVYGLFEREDTARVVAADLESAEQTWIARPRSDR
jgi:4-diphosphocytidyl-2-C-methyl-D-erythritol kinase